MSHRVRFVSDRLDNLEFPENDDCYLFRQSSGFMILNERVLSGRGEPGLVYAKLLIALQNLQFKKPIKHFNGSNMVLKSVMELS